MTREELIAALEKATGPSRDLDAAIFAHVGLTEFQERHCRQWCGQNGRTDLTRGHYLAAWAPDFTRSIDAALTLVPEGWRWSLDWTQRSGYQDCGRADLYAPGSGIQPPDVCDVYAATPAIALCIAALKAQGGGA